VPSTLTQTTTSRATARSYTAARCHASVTSSRASAPRPQPGLGDVTLDHLNPPLQRRLGGAELGYTSVCQSRELRLHQADRRTVGAFQDARQQRAPRKPGNLSSIRSSLHSLANPALMRMHVTYSRPVR
jgi:hypothetical protein